MNENSVTRRKSDFRDEQISTNRQEANKSSDEFIEICKELNSTHPNVLLLLFFFLVIKYTAKFRVNVLSLSVLV